MVLVEAPPLAADASASPRLRLPALAGAPFPMPPPRSERPTPSPPPPPPPQVFSNSSVSSGVGVYWMFYTGGDFAPLEAPRGLPGLDAGAPVEGLRMRPGLAMSQASGGAGAARRERRARTGLGAGCAAPKRVSAVSWRALVCSRTVLGGLPAPAGDVVRLPETAR